MNHTVLLPDPEATWALGEQVAGLLRAGDVVILSGDLGAGKTTLAQGIGRGLGVRGPVTSPTFVIARVHPATGTGPGLVHVDAYRLGSAAELDALDLDTTLEEFVTVIEWGEGLAEALAPDRLEVLLERDLRGADGGRAEDADPRRARLRGIGPRWADTALDKIDVGREARIGGV
ncbi:MAG: tRNA (adenosine(37)-N6)-threonylcarbamoyltransferase complex ATPase subunit type 1 TsaE [Bifidobacteriaceae bacterium]|nr:tRNA (adenosine(37)-N6)-threonylcarbamoyltransferase complex ATPase subunit type 1 TsaE [Bifidobacteriaceae bacterium]